MIFRKNVRKVVFSFCFVLWSVFFYGCINYYTRAKINDAIVDYFYNDFGLMIIPLGEGKYILVDTGTEISTLFRDRVQINSTIRGFALTNNQRISPIKRVESFQIGDLIIRNHNFVLTKSRNTLQANDTTIVGIIGMDILSLKHSYFDIKNQTITLSDEKQVQAKPPSLVFSYKSPRRPVSDLCINSYTFENVLFDTGFNVFLALLEKDKNKLSTTSFCCMGTSVVFDFSKNKRFVYSETPDSVQINGVSIANPIISYGHKSRLLGMEFVKQWSSFSIDPFEKKIEFFK